MHQGIGQIDDLLSVGARYAHDTHALCNDVAAVIFPTALTSPTDATISAVTIKLVQLVSDIEQQLGDEPTSSPRPVSWSLLSQSGFLREADLVDFVLARVAEDRIETMLDPQTAILPIQLLDHADGNVAKAAQMLLAADSLHRQARGNTYSSLPAELLHKLCWRVVAALEVSQGSRSAQRISAARAMLAGYDEAQSIKATARKILHLIEEERQVEFFRPETAGVHLHVAAISAALDVEHDHVLRLIDAGSSAPYAIMLAALGIPKEIAVESILLLCGETLTPRDAGVFQTSYAKIGREQALAEIANWSLARSQYLAFGQQ